MDKPVWSIGQLFCHYILIDNAEYITRPSILPIPRQEFYSDFMDEQFSEVTQKIEGKIGNAG